MKELNWIASNPEERAKYRGEYIAVVGERIVAHGEDPAQVWDMATTFVQSLFSPTFRRLRL